MIITKEILNQKAPKEMIPSRLDSALNLFTCINNNTKSGILVYNTNPSTWNCLYPFYELNHKFTLDNYNFNIKEPTYEDLIKEYESVYKKIYEEEKGYIKKERINLLLQEYKKTFKLNNVKIVEELTPIYELKYSKTKNVWTLYYFENYVANDIDNINDLINQKLYEQKILPIDCNIQKLNGIEIVSNLPYILSFSNNVEKLNNNIINLDNK